MAPGQLKTTVITAVVTLFVSAVGAGIGWGFVDRIHWAANEKQIEITVQDVKEVKQELLAFPSAYVSRREHENIEKKAEEQHRETMDAIRHLEGRIDQWMKDQRRSRSQSIFRPEREPVGIVSRK